MKTPFPILAAGVTALASTLLSGCYMDRKPNLTLEERVMADDRESGEMAAVKTRPATCEEYANARGRATRVDAFDLPLEAGKSHAAFFFIKHRDLATGERTVEAIGEAVLVAKDSPVTMFCELEGDRFVALSPKADLNLKTGGALLSRLSTMLTASGPGPSALFRRGKPGDRYLHAEGDVKPGARLTPPSGATGRFLIRNIGFVKLDGVGELPLGADSAAKLVATSGIVFEVECILEPFLPGFNPASESARMKTFLEATWATPGSVR